MVPPWRRYQPTPCRHPCPPIWSLSVRRRTTWACPAALRAVRRRRRAVAPRPPASASGSTGSTRQGRRLFHHDRWSVRRFSEQGDRQGVQAPQDPGRTWHGLHRHGHTGPSGRRGTCSGARVGMRATSLTRRAEPGAQPPVASQLAWPKELPVLVPGMVSPADTPSSSSEGVTSRTRATHRPYRCRCRDRTHRGRCRRGKRGPGDRCVHAGPGSVYSPPKIPRRFSTRRAPCVRV